MINLRSHERDCRAYTFVGATRDKGVPPGPLSDTAGKGNTGPCKGCKKPIEITLNGLKSFCSYECKKAHKRAYMADLMQRKRNVSISGGYIGMDSQNVSTANPHEKPIEKAQNQGHGLSEDNFQGWGGEDRYELAKKYCCNFGVRDKEGFCVSFTEPIKIFRAKCSDCKFGNALYKGVANKNPGH